MAIVTRPSMGPCAVVEALARALYNMDSLQSLGPINRLLPWPLLVGFPASGRLGGNRSQPFTGIPCVVRSVGGLQ